MSGTTERIGVLGAGVMGSGIAQVMAIAGHEVVCYDLADEALEKGRGIVDTGRFGVRSAVERGKFSAEDSRRRARTAHVHRRLRRGVPDRRRSSRRCPSAST